MTSTQPSATSPVKPEPIFGQIINLGYSQNSQNLTEMAIQDYDDPKTIFLFALEPYLKFNPKTMKITNLNNFQVRLQEAFNYQYFVNMSYENDQINSLILITYRNENFREDKPCAGFSSSFGRIFASQCCASSCNPRRW
jgi:hypothetical protein